MDLVAAIGAASQAVGLVKQIRDLDKALDEAVFKSRLIELQEAILEVKSALLEAKSTILERDDRIQNLERELKAAKGGDSCPICREGTMNVTSARPHPMFGEVGVKEHSRMCSKQSCGHRDTLMVDPIGLVSK